MRLAHQSQFWGSESSRENSMNQRLLSKKGFCILFEIIVALLEPIKKTFVWFIEAVINCIHQIASGGYYGFDFVMPTPLPQGVERFHCYRSNKKNIIASLVKFAGYIHSHKILPGNIFGLILKSKMAATGVFRL